MKKYSVLTLAITIAALVACNKDEGPTVPQNTVDDHPTHQTLKIDGSWPYPQDFSDICAQMYEDVVGEGEKATHLETTMSIFFDQQAGFNQPGAAPMLCYWSDFDPDYDGCGEFQNLAFLSLLSVWAADFESDWEYCDDNFGYWTTTYMNAFRIEDVDFTYYHAGDLDFALSWQNLIVLPNPIYVCLQCDEMKDGGDDSDIPLYDREDYTGPTMKEVQEHFDAIARGEGYDSPLVSTLAEFGWEPEPRP